MDEADRNVREQYEAYPYPSRDPADEAHRLITGSPSHILEIEHFILRGGRARGLENISFHQGSLLDLPGRGWPPFDYIDCCGVLHHLADPAAGLAALVAVLAPGGGLGLMLYGELGRTGVYPAQRAIARLAGDGPASGGRPGRRTPGPGPKFDRSAARG